MKKCLFTACMVVLAACGGSDSADGTDAGSLDAPTTVPAVQSDAADAPADVPETTEAPADEPPATAGSHGIVLTIGDETWDFPSAFCAYQNAPAGEEGSEWNVSMVHGDLQVYITGDSYGSEVSITDIVNYGDLQWVAEGGAVKLTVDGNNIAAEGTFTDAAAGLPDQEGTLTATCSGWAEG